MRGSPALSASILRYGVSAALLGLAAGLGFALWAENSAGIFLALTDSALSWCF